MDSEEYKEARRQSKERLRLWRRAYMMGLYDLRDKYRDDFEGLREARYQELLMRHER